MDIEKLTREGVFNALSDLFVGIEEEFNLQGAKEFSDDRELRALFVGYLMGRGYTMDDINGVMLRIESLNSIVEEFFE